MKTVSLWVLTVLFVGAGLLHLLDPNPFLKIMPPYVPDHGLIVMVSGIAEIMGGFGIVIPATRSAARWGLVILLAAVFPANVYMAEQHIQLPGIHIPQTLLWIRLLFQPLLMWWVLVTTVERKLK